MNQDDLPGVQIYTDGGCDPNPGPGGWGAVLRFEDREWLLSGSDPETTNNRMELQAATAALALLKELLGRCRVHVHTDSEYLRRGISEWIQGWQRNGWRTADRLPVKNQDLWQRLHALSQAHDMTWHWLKGHAGHPLNERADRLATAARQALRPRSEPMAKSQASDAPPPVEMCVKASYLGAQGVGGWAAVLRRGERIKTLSGGEAQTSANALLIRAATHGLRALKRPCRVIVYSDAEYLVKGATLWLKGWQARNWRTREDRPVANREAWEALIEAAGPHRVTWLSARGDQAPADMAQAEALAVEAARAVDPIEGKGFD